MICKRRSFTNKNDFNEEKISVNSVGVISLAIGQGHTCIMIMSGRVECEGLNKFNQLAVPEAAQSIFDKTKMG